MTNKEKYQKAFSVLHASDRCRMEAEDMMKMKKANYKKTVAAAAAAAILLVGGTGTAYAANVGGIQRTIQLWIYGDQTTATLTANDDDTYTITYSDKDGNEKTTGTGGVAIQADGTEAPLTPEEIEEHLNMPDVEYEDDGSVWVYYQDQKLDITDKFVDGVCYTKIEGKDKTLYLTVKYDNGYAVSENKYISPDEFNMTND